MSAHTELGVEAFVGALEPFSPKTLVSSPSNRQFLGTDALLTQVPTLH